MFRSLFLKSGVMLILVALTTITTSLLVAAPQQDDWQVWRGPNRNGVAPGEQRPPTEWDEDTNVVWKAKLPGRGHASPTIVGDRIFLATELDGTQSVVCCSRNDGQQLWQTTINEGGLPARINANNTHASSTVTSDGERVFVVFYNNDRVQVVALDFDGNKLWEKSTGEYIPHFEFGFGASPIVYGPNVIVTSDNKSESAIVAYNRESGLENWRIERDKATGYSTPVVAELGGRMQMLISGGGNIASYDPDSGEELWRSPTVWQVSCGTLVWDPDKQIVFASGGYPRPQTLAVSADGSGDKLWENVTKSYEQSMIFIDGYVYTLTDNGGVYCWDGEDGTEIWKERLEGNVSASPVLAGGNIYFTAESGTTYVVAANHEGFELIAKNSLGVRAFATPTILNDRIYMRIEDNAGDQWLFCLGE